MVITLDFQSGDESSILSICSNDYEAIGWRHLTKVELKYTLYCKAEIGSNPIIITNSQSSEWYLYDSVDKPQGSESQSCGCRFESYTDYKNN